MLVAASGHIKLTDFGEHKTLAFLLFAILFMFFCSLL